MIQASTETCRHCKRLVVVYPTASPHEFTYDCLTCGLAGVISWAHNHPPPTFGPMLAQPALDFGCERVPPVDS